MWSPALTETRVHALRLSTAGSSDSGSVQYSRSARSLNEASSNVSEYGPTLDVPQKPNRIGSTQISYSPGGREPKKKEPSGVAGCMKPDTHEVTYSNSSIRPLPGVSSFLRATTLAPNTGIVAPRTTLPWIWPSCVKAGCVK